MRFRKFPWLMMILCLVTLSASVIADDDDDDCRPRRYYQSARYCQPVRSCRPVRCCRPVCCPPVCCPPICCEVDCPSGQVEAPAICPHTPIQPTTGNLWEHLADYWDESCMPYNCWVEVPLDDYESWCENGCCPGTCIPVRNPHSGPLASAGEGSKRELRVGPCHTPDTYDKTPFPLDKALWKQLTEEHIVFDYPAGTQMNAKVWTASSVKTINGQIKTIHFGLEILTDGAPAPSPAGPATLIPIGDQKCQLSVKYKKANYVVKTDGK